MPGPVRDAADAYQQVEAMLLRQMLQSSGAFKASEVAGGQMRADMFVQTLADAVSKGGGIGIARMLEDSFAATQGADDGDDGEPAPAKLGRRPGAAGPHASAPHTSVPDVATPHASLGQSGLTPAVLDLDLGAAPIITSPFGRRPDPIDGGTKYHTGVDLRAPEGSAIKVAADGVVKTAGQRGGYGNAVEIDHGQGLTTLYAHASELLVTPGQKVSEGEVIGLAGMTGRATGPHLHFEVRVNDYPARSGACS